MSCVKECEFIRFDGRKNFRCEFYDRDLQVTLSHDELCILRCDECWENGDVPKVSKLSVIREHVGHTNDKFYAFKQKFEETMISILELLQKLEDGHEEKLELLQKLEDN